MKEYTVKDESGGQKWYLDGKLHREDGPAVIWADGTEEWWLNGKLHREGGPAVIWPSGAQAWWLNGNRVTEEEVMNQKS